LFEGVLEQHHKLLTTPKQIRHLVRFNHQCLTPRDHKYSYVLSSHLFLHHLKKHKHQFTIQKIFEVPKKNRNSDVIELEDRTETLGTIYISLFDNQVPNTAQIFRDLATGIHGYGYLNSSFHRIIPKCVIQGGIVTIEDEMAGELIYTSTIQGKQPSIKLTYPTFKVSKTKASLGLVTVTVYGYDRTMYGNHTGTARIV
jgi:hypothetical protein